MTDRELSLLMGAVERAWPNPTWTEAIAEVRERVEVDAPGLFDRYDIRFGLRPGVLDEFLTVRSVNPRSAVDRLAGLV